MNYRFSLQVLALGALVLVGGCRAGSALSYERCAYSSDCQRPSDTCITLVHASGGASAQICSSTCRTSSDCPLDRNGSVASCVSFNGGTSFQCYQSCSPAGTTALCESGLVCTNEATSGGGLATNICYPPGGGSGTSLSYDTCSSSADCVRSGDQCITLVHASGGSAASICSSTCRVATDCPLDRNGVAGSCVSFDGGSSFQCYQSCGGASSCTSGLVCTSEAGGGSATNICYPPGSSTAAAYAGCAGGMLCQSGTSCISVKDRTTVELCTRTNCSSDNDCPLDSRGSLGACVRLDGDAFATCVERCNSSSQCTYPSAERCTNATNLGVSLPPPGVCLP